MHAWCRRFEQEGLPGLADRSRRPRTSPKQLDADIEALICELRRTHPRWGARRIEFELGQRGVKPAPVRATVHRVLVQTGWSTPRTRPTSLHVSLDGHYIKTVPSRLSVEQLSELARRGAIPAG